MTAENRKDKLRKALGKWPNNRKKMTRVKRAKG
jgi:hypothetical protein